VQWRQELEWKFVFDQAKGIPQQELLRFKLKYFQIRQDLEGKLRRGLADLSMNPDSTSKIFSSLMVAIRCELPGLRHSKALACNASVGLFLDPVHFQL
jgi:hypothetical protein